MASALASTVLPVPGTSSMSRWPSASMAIMPSRTTSGLPSTTREIAAAMRPPTSATWSRFGRGGRPMRWTWSPRLDCWANPGRPAAPPLSSRSSAELDTSVVPGRSAPDGDLDLSGSRPTEDSLPALRPRVVRLSSTRAADVDTFLAPDRMTTVRRPCYVHRRSVVGAGPRPARAVPMERWTSDRAGRTAAVDGPVRPATSRSIGPIAQPIRHVKRPAPYPRAARWARCGWCRYRCSV